MATALVDNVITGAIRRSGRPTTNNNDPNLAPILNRKPDPQNKEDQKISVPTHFPPNWNSDGPAVVRNGKTLYPTFLLNSSCWFWTPFTHAESLGTIHQPLRLPPSWPFLHVRLLCRELFPSQRNSSARPRRVRALVRHVETSRSEARGHEL